MAFQIQIAALYAGLNALVLLTLAFLVVRQRGKTGLGIGEGPAEGPLHRAIRAHGNAVENVPVILVLLVILELSGASVLLLHGVGAGLLLGRVLHGFGLSRSGGESLPRLVGTVLTWIALIAAAVGCVHYAIMSP